MFINESIMRFNKHFNILTISNNILRPVIIIVLSLTNFHSGLTSHVEMSYANLNGILVRSNKSKMLSADSAADILTSSSLKPTSSFENRRYQHSDSFLQFQSSRKNNGLLNNTQRIPKESKKYVNIDFVSNTNEQFIQRLTSSPEKHQAVDLVRPHFENNLITNSSSETLNTKIPIHFGTENASVIATQIGATAHISCIVHYIGKCVVSWIKKKDYHLLTVGLTTYSSDERFSVTHLKHSEDWTLQIKFVQEHDAGVYECQVSTHPPTSIFLHLYVAQARAEISGPKIRYLTPGSTLRIQCHVVQNTQSSDYIFWYHDNRMINYDADRGINVSTDPEFQSSELTISRTRREHSGNYTCIASNTQPASVLVHIFKGDNPAAMYHGHVGSSTKSFSVHLLYIITIDIAITYGSVVKRKRY